MRHPLLPILLTAVVGLAACQQSETYRHFEAIDDAGWDITDRIAFTLPPVQHTGDYDLLLHLRTSTATPYPYKDLYVEVTGTRSVGADSLVEHTDTVVCPLADQETPSTGIVIRQYAFPIRTLHCQTDDTLRFTLRHVMRRELISGITDIGITLQPR